MDLPMYRICVVLVLLLAGCVALPDRIKPVDNFKVARYLGKWYEIVRLDHSFERGLTKVTAEYSLREDGGVKVLNSGYSEAKKTWKTAEGTAYFVENADQGYLQVSFFWPFYGAYVIFELDHEHYQYSLVCGPDRSYFWLLSRTPTMPTAIKDKLIAKAAQLGFDTSKLITVVH